MNTTKEQYDIAKVIVDAYEKKTGEKVVSVSVTMDSCMQKYLNPQALNIFAPKLTEEQIEMYKKCEEQNKKFFNGKHFNNGKC